jgi:thioredoxin reductase
MSKDTKKYDVIIIGAGPAGITAALFAKKARALGFAVG